MALQHPIPPLFCDYLSELLPTEAEALLTALKDEPSVSVRLNARKITVAPSSLPLDTAVPWLSLWASTSKDDLPLQLTHFGMQVSTTSKKPRRCSSIR